MMTSCINKMQSETADFAPVPPLGEMDETRVFFDFGLFCPLYENIALSTKPEVHIILHCRQRMSNPRPRGSVYRKVSEIWTCGWRYASGHINRQSNRQATDTLNTPLGG